MAEKHFNIDGGDDNGSANGNDSPASGDPLLDALATQVMDDAPDVQQHAIDTHESATIQEDAEAERDASGTPFDSSIHTGSKLKNGNWRLKRSASSQGSSVAGPRASRSTTSSQTEPVRSDQDVKAEMSGKACAHMIFMLGQAFGGQEWKPSDDEVAMQEGAWIGYARAKNMEDVPPGLVLCTALAAYALPRFRMPETQERASRAKGWIALRIAKWKLKRELKRRGIQATVTIKNATGKNLRDELLIDGKPVVEVLK